MSPITLEEDLFLSNDFLVWANIHQMRSYAAPQPNDLSENGGALRFPKQARNFYTGIVLYGREISKRYDGHFCTFSTRKVIIIES